MSPEFEFSDRMAVIFENMDTVREIQKSISEDGCVGEELQAFVDDLWESLPKLAPEFSAWTGGKVKDGALYIWPDDGWKVTKDGNVAVCVYPSGVVDPSWWDERDDPWVGVDAPEGWDRLEEFIARLKQIKPHGFMDRDQGDWSTGSALGVYVHLREHVMEAAFDTVGFRKEILERLKQLAKLRPQIDGIIRDLKKLKG